MLDQYTIASIIGFYRGGATIEEIIGVTMLNYWQVHDAIAWWQKEQIEKIKLEYEKQ